MAERISPYNPDVFNSTDPVHIAAELLAANPVENRVKLTEAIEFAGKAHEGQLREQENAPFIVHPLRVAYSLAQAGYTDLTTQISAVLHDAVEDNPTISIEMIAEKFGRGVAKNVALLSKIIQGNFKKLVDYHRALRQGPEDAKRIKVFDRIDNLWSWARQKGNDIKRARKIVETKENILPLASFDPELRRQLNDAINAVKDSFGYGFTANLKRQLEANGIDIGNWGKNATRSVLDLTLEIVAKESKLSSGKDRKLQREINIVAVDVRYEDSETGLEYRLVEERQEFKDGTKRTRDISFSLAEKLKLTGKGIMTGVKRACVEELSIFDIQNSQITLGDKTVSTGFSRGYPGLETKYVAHSARVNLARKQFRPNGYIEEQPDKTTYFRWEIVVK